MTLTRTQRGETKKVRTRGTFSKRNGILLHVPSFLSAVLGDGV